MLMNADQVTSVLPYLVFSSFFLFLFVFQNQVVEEAVVEAVEAVSEAEGLSEWGAFSREGCQSYAQLEVKSVPETCMFFMFSKHQKDLVLSDLQLISV